MMAAFLPAEKVSSADALLLLPLAQQLEKMMQQQQQRTIMQEVTLLLDWAIKSREKKISGPKLHFQDLFSHTHNRKCVTDTPMDHWLHGVYRPTATYGKCLSVETDVRWGWCSLTHSHAQSLVWPQESLQIQVKCKGSLVLFNVTISCEIRSKERSLARNSPSSFILKVWRWRQQWQ